MKRGAARRVPGPAGRAPRPAVPPRLTTWALLLIAAHVALASWGALRNSVTFDENFHVPAGVAIVVHRNFNGSVAQPPAAKALYGAAALAAGARAPGRSAITGDEFTLGRAFAELNRDRYSRVYLAARAVGVLFSALLAWLVWRLATRMHGPRGGLLSLAAYAFAPEALAHAGLAGIDMPFALGTTASVAAFWCFARSGRWRWFAATALALGLTLATRFNAYQLGVAFVLIALIGTALGRVRRPARLWTGIALLPLTSLLALNLAYLGQAPLRPLRELPVRSHAFQALRERLPGLRLPVPEAALAGLDYLALLATPGERDTYLFGEVRRGPVWSYFPVALALKWPLGLLGLIALRIGTSVTRRASARRRWNDAFVLVPAVVVLGATMLAQVNAGVRYLFPMLPLLCVGCGGLLAPGAGGRAARAARTARAVRCREPPTCDTLPHPCPATSSSRSAHPRTPRSRACHGPRSLARLRHVLHELGSCVVAYSGGVDSSVLLRVAHEVLGGRAVGVIGRSDSYARRELEAALTQAASFGAAVEIVTTGELSDPAFASNPVNRCYHCKNELFRRLGEVRARHGAAAVLDGTIADDARDYRPGRHAAAERAVRSPLAELGFTKAEVRAVARHFGLASHDKPASPCLASRIPHGTAITSEGLAMVEAGEQALHALGFRECRVRHFGDTARIEVPLADLPRLLERPVRERAIEALKRAGFTVVTLDLEGFRSGSLNPLPGRNLGGEPPA